ncbi:CaiB/BaiF CoA-transferase family protein [Microbacterium lacus]|uniref:CaiB/BaiF CoA-transferase family protein n=1 Tax=Microbacterium lacus TaxID=415217 RepID=A0ABP4TAC4_9MICO
MTNAPLAGVTVLSLEQAVAAPFATRQLADLGARVIKVERPEGDFARDYDTKVYGESSFFTWLNRGKESVVVDLKTADGIALIRRIIRTADVFVQNLAPGAVGRLGLDPLQLHAEEPSLIAASISGYGGGGPAEKKKAYDLLIQCEAGLVSVTGSPDAPAKVGISIADIAAGMYTYSGVLTALYEREKTGAGQVFEVSMLEALGEWMAQPYFYARYGGADPARAGARHASIAPYGPMACRDGTVFLGVQNDREWAALCRDVLNRPDLAEDHRFVGNTGRMAHRQDLEDVLAAAFSGIRVDEAEARLDAAGIANARLRTMQEFADHPQLEARRRWRDIATRSGVVRATVPPVTVFGREPLMGPVPAIGEHSEQIRAEFGAGGSA